MGERDNAQNNHVGGADTGSRDPTLRTQRGATVRTVSYR